MERPTGNTAFEEGLEIISCYDTTQEPPDLWADAEMHLCPTNPYCIDCEKIPVPGVDANKKTGRYEGWFSNKANVERRATYRDDWSDCELHLGKVAKLGFRNPDIADANFKDYFQSIRKYIETRAASINVVIRFNNPSINLRAWSFRLKPTMSYADDFEVAVVVDGQEIPFVEFWTKIKEAAAANNAWPHCYVTVDLSGLSGVAKGFSARVLGALKRSS